MKRKVRISSIFMGLLFLFGLALVLYPFVSDELNNYLDDRLIEVYQEKANKQNEKELAQSKKKWTEKNEQLVKEAGGQVIGNDPFATPKKEVKNEKDYFQKHTIAFLNVPKIKLKLPIFDGTNDLLLEKGAGLLEGTSYPIGGESTHAVLSTHRGLETAKLFTDLPKLIKGDYFILSIANEKHAYEVDKITVVEPDDTEELRIVKDQDYVTLLTCTPFMVNSHRLLVRGHRVPYTEEMKNETEKSEQTRSGKRWLLIAICVGIVFLIILFILKSRKKSN